MGTSTFVANLLASNRLAYVGSALRLANILMTKMPEIFSKYLTREGAIFEIERLASPGFLEKKENDTSTTAEIRTYINIEAEKFKKKYFTSSSEKVCFFF